MTEELTKSIDSLIDELFEEEDSFGKSMIKDEKPQKETSDEALKHKDAKYEEDDAERGAGRSKAISDVPKKDTDGQRAKKYDDAISEKNEDAKKEEDKQVQPAPHMKKSLSDEEYEEYQALKKAKEESEKEEALKKAEQEKADLIKSAVLEAKKDWDIEREELKKSLEEQGELIKAMANRPQRKKSVTNVAALEKSSTSYNESPELSAAEIKALASDVAEGLVKSNKITVDQAIELDNNGFILDPEARRLVEAGVKKEIKNRS